MKQNFNKKTGSACPRKGGARTEKIPLPLQESRNSLKFRELRDISFKECDKFVTPSQTETGPDRTSPQKKMTVQKTNSLRGVLGYVPAKLVTGKRWFVEFYAYDPEILKMHRKRISIKMIKPVSLRRQHANEIAAEINDQLRRGWNPFIAQLNPKQCTLFDKAVEQYFRLIHKLTQEDVMRVKTYNGYVSYMNVFRSWVRDHERKLVYTYQFKKDLIDDFLDYLWLEEGKSARTRDNYLAWLRAFAKFLLEKELISEDPTSGMTMVQGKRKVEKNRAVIPKDAMITLKKHLEENDRHFLLACYILYYCFIRPKEMSYIRLADISVKKGTIIVYGEVAKNRKGGTVTLPDCVIQLMLELDVFSASDDSYLFSDGCRPGKHYRGPKMFTDKWTALRKFFGWPDEYKFYSLKDTGITDMITDSADMIAVRDQARHSSLEMTDKYTPLWAKEANEKIRHRKSYF